MMGLGIIVAMWWTYFDVNALAAERHLRALSSVPRVRLAQHVFTYLHLPMIIGAIFFSPNPPKDTDGRREGSGRGWVRELQGRWPGLLG